MKNSIINSSLIGAVGMFLILGCGGANQNSTTTTNPATTANANSAAAPTEKPLAVQAKALTKEYDENELAADGKYKGKMLAVSGKVANIAETFGNVTASLEGHNAVISVMCSFDESEKGAVAKLKKGGQATFVGTGDGMTGGMYAGLGNCRIQ